MDDHAAYEATDLCFSYHPGKPVIQPLRLELSAGQTVGLTGSSGGGKTTLGKILAGILKPSGGGVSLFGKNMESLELYQIGRLVGYCFQNPDKQLFSLSVEEELSFGLRFQGMDAEAIRRRIEPLARELEVAHLYGRFPPNLSWGEKRRVALAACLALEPRFLILDEPTVGLDGNRIDILNRVLAALRARKIGMLLISHNRDFLTANVDRLLRMEEGSVTDEGV